MSDQDRPLTDHDVHRACYGFLRMWDTLTPEAMSAITRSGRGVHTMDTTKLSGVISHAITGFAGHDTSRENAVIPGVDYNLTPSHRRALRSTLLPELDAEIHAFAAALAALVQTAYDAGVKDGSDLLAGLASGRTSVSDFNRRTTGA